MEVLVLYNKVGIIGIYSTESDDSYTKFISDLKKEIFFMTDSEKEREELFDDIIESIHEGNEVLNIEYFHNQKIGYKIVPLF